MRKVNIGIFVAVCVFLAVLAGPVSGRTIYVDPNGSADFTTIQAAIDDPCTLTGDQIEVAPAIYNEAINFNGKAVRLYSSGGPDVTTIDANGISGAYHVVQCISSEDANTILEGFTISGGNANGTYPDNCGGGMLNNSSSPTVTDCNFSLNSAVNDGAGMYNYGNSNPTISNCTFSNNTAVWGAGMYNYQSSPTLSECTFTANTATNGAGGMGNNASSPTLSNCTFSGNQAVNEWGGGMINNSSSSPMVTNCTFSGNSADDGGGMCNIGSSPTVTNCTFSGNSAIDGGGMCNYESNPTVINCTLSDNSASDLGGGMCNFESSPTVTNCTFSGNTAGVGTGMFNYYYSSPTVTNCILWGDTPEEIYDDTSTTTVNYSDVQGDPVYPGTGNINADPRFADAAGGNLRLGLGSPCIDAGNNTAVPAVVLKDLGGKLRFADDPCTPDTGDAGTTGRPVVDMGAYEFQGSGTTSQNLLANPGFEVGDATGWVTNWGFSLTADTNQVHDGNYSGLASNRTASWQGAWQSLLGLMDDGRTYRISGWVRLQNETSDNVILTVTQTDSAGAQYHRIDQATGTDDQWVHLDGTLALDVVGQLTDLYVYFEGPAPQVNFYVDDAAVTEVMGDMNHNGGVDFIDFSLFASYYGFDCSTQDCGRANLDDSDNTINELDLAILCNNWLAGTEP